MITKTTEFFLKTFDYSVVNVILLVSICKISVDVVAVVLCCDRN
jgi:hypothetical protein